MKLDDMIRNALQDDAVPPASPLDYEKMWTNVEKVIDEDKRNPFARCKNRLLSISRKKLKECACAAAAVMILAVMVPMAINRFNLSSGSVQKPSAAKTASPQKSDADNPAEGGQYMIVQNDQAELRSNANGNERVKGNLGKGTVAYVQPDHMQRDDGTKWSFVEVSTVDLAGNMSGWIEDKNLAPISTSNISSIKSYLALYKGAEAYDVDSFDKVNKSKLVKLKEDRMVVVKEETNGFVLVRLADGKQYVVERNQLAIPDEFYMGKPWIGENPTMAVGKDKVKNEQEAALKLANAYFEKLKGSDTSIRHRITDFEIKRIENVGKGSTPDGRTCETYRVELDVKPYAAGRFNGLSGKVDENGWVYGCKGCIKVASGKEYVLDSFHENE